MYGRDTRDLGERRESTVMNYVKVFVLVIIVRIVMVDQGVTFVNIPFLDKGLREGIRYVKNMMADPNYYGPRSH